MDFNKPIFVKSLEADLATQRLVDGIKRPFQSLEEMVSPQNGERPNIKPNTVSFGQADRLSCTILSANYTKTYRPQGIIFQTDMAPDYIAPFDLMVLADVPGENIVADYYSIVNELQEHYGRSLIPGYEKFLFRTAEEMFAKIPNPEIALRLVDDFRRAHGLSPFPESERKLVLYNEAVFHKDVIIEPVAIFGDPNFVPNLQERADKLGVPVNDSASGFWERMEGVKKEIKRETNARLR